MSKFEHMTDSCGFDWASLFNYYIDPKTGICRMFDGLMVTIIYVHGHVVNKLDII